MTVNEWNTRLLQTRSHERGDVLLEAWDEGDLTMDEYRSLVGEWWTSVDAWGDRLDEALEMLRWVAPIGEIPANYGTTFTVYRTTAGEEPDGGSWTLERSVADHFVTIFSGPRGAFLGIRASTPVDLDGDCGC